MPARKPKADPVPPHDPNTVLRELRDEAQRQGRWMSFTSHFGVHKAFSTREWTIDESARVEDHTGNGRAEAREQQRASWQGATMEEAAARALDFIRKNPLAPVEIGGRAP